MVAARHGLGRRERQQGSVATLPRINGGMIGNTSREKLQQKQSRRIWATIPGNSETPTVKSDHGECPSQPLVGGGALANGGKEE